MEPADASPPKSAFRIVVVVLAGLLLGNFVATGLCYVQPKRYESRAVVIDGTPPGQSTRLSAAHAAAIIAILSLEDRWGVWFEDAVKELQAGIEIQSTDEGTVLTGRFQSAQDARMILEVLAEGHQGLEREASWARMDADPYSPTDGKNLNSFRHLRALVAGELAESFAAGEVVHPESIVEMENDDLTRQFRAYQALDQTGRFSPPDGLFSMPFTIIEAPVEAQYPASPNVELHLLAGRIGGLLAGGIALLLISRFRPSLIEAPAKDSWNEPDWAKTRTDPSRKGQVEY